MGLPALGQCGRHGSWCVLGGKVCQNTLKGSKYDMCTFLALFFSLSSQRCAEQYTLAYVNQPLHGLACEEMVYSEETTKEKERFSAGFEMDCPSKHIQEAIKI